MRFAMQGSMQGELQVAVQRLANVVLTSKSVRAQWRVTIGVRTCLVWSSCGVICCHRKRLGTGVSARSQFRVVSASCLFVFLNRVSESFGLSSRPIRSGDVRFHFLPLEVCVGRVCLCKFAANTISRGRFCLFCHSSRPRHRVVWSSGLRSGTGSVRGNLGVVNCITNRQK